MTGAFGCDCSNRRKREADAEDAARQIPRYGQGIPVGSTRLVFHNSHSAMATAAQSADPEYPEGRIAINAIRIADEIA